MMKWTGSAIAVAAVLAAAAMMPTLKAAEETPMITVYEANVTDMDGYKNQFLTALQPKIDKAQERLLARGETQPPNRASSSCVGRRPCGVSLSTKPGTSCDSCAVTSCSDKPVFSDKALIMDGPRADPSEPG